MMVDHQSDLSQTIADMNEAFVWLPKSVDASEAEPLQVLAGKKRRGPQAIGDLLIGLLIRLGVSQENPVASKPSEALKS